MTLKNYSTGILAGVLLISVILVALLGIQPVGQTKARSASPLPVSEQFSTEMENRLNEIVFGEVAIKKKVYTISDSAIAAPAPDQTCYGEAETASELQWLLEKAEPLLEGQTLYFSLDKKLAPGSTVHYYLDDTIFAITWKEEIQRSIFTFSEIKLLHPSQFRRYLSGGEFASGTLSRTSEMAKDVNAVVACSGDYYSYRRKGITVIGGIVQKAISGVADICFIDRNGDLILERGLAFDTPEEVQAYVDKHDINFSLSFGPILIKDGVNCCPKNYSLGEVLIGYPRAALCQMGKLHYLFVTSNMELHYYGNLSMAEFAECLMQTGCIHAYALDGGQTATIVMNNEVINNVNYGSQRYISDIIYFATAKPAEEKQE